MDELELFRRTRELEQRADTDSLTGLVNRRAFNAALERAVRWARRTGEPLSLLRLDLDHFKALNDNAGHMAGDEALRRFGLVLAQAARRLDDTAARYGGEEFALILPGTDKAGVVDVARMVADGLATAAVPHPKGIGGVLTASVGATTVAPSDIQDPETLVARADAALYRAKGMGRNQVIHTAGE